ncbi:MAG: HDIG domain-containing metalloprotein [Planctomycetota bacterium]|jgi:putative nucleotidyltransferase with HDIG domain
MVEADGPTTLNLQDARCLLLEHGSPTEAWVEHCHQVAKVAHHLGAALLQAGAEFDLELLEVRALLHDIGRTKTHGALHGWSGYRLLHGLGFALEGRGCLTHWLKGRSQEEVAENAIWEPSLAARAFAALDPPVWELADSVLSVADSCVQHTTVVPMAVRHRDLNERYGESVWLTRAMELAESHAAEIEEALGFPLDALLAPLYGDPSHADRT